MTEKKFGVFDFDGTIVDTMPIYFNLSGEIIQREYGLPAEEFIEYSKLFTGKPIDEMFRDFLLKNNKPVDRIYENLQDFFTIVNAYDFPLIDGAREAIESVYNKGFQLFISTGSETEKTKERLDDLGLLRFFSEVYGSSSVAKGPAHIENFARIAGVSLGEFAGRAFFLGDGPGDMKLAKACNMKAVGVAHTFTSEYLRSAGADVVFEKIREAGDADLI
jgi:phosphoglycolate phosphatase-like HAD superfamily hydrolase